MVFRRRARIWRTKHLGDVIDKTPHSDHVLQVGEERLRLALDAAELGSFIWYPNEDRTDPDVRMLELFGVETDADITLEEALTRLIHPDDRERYGEAVQRAVDPSGDGRLREEIRVLWPDGEQRWLVVFGRTSFAGNSNEVTQMAGIVADITDQRAAAEAEARLASLVSSSQDAIMTVNLDNRFTTWNESAERLFGYSAEEAVGQPVDLIVPEELRDEMQRILNARIHGEYLRPFDTVRRRKDGSLVAVSLAVSPIFDRSGRLVASSAVLRDISARKKLEAEAAEQARRSEFLVELADALRPVADPLEVQVVATSLLGEYLGVDRVFYGEIIGNGSEYVVAPGYTSPHVPPLVGRFALDDVADALLSDIRRGLTVIIDDVAAHPSFSKDEKAAFREGQVASAIGVPLVKDNDWVALLSIHQRSARAWTDHERELIEETAERTWAAVERARAEAALRRSQGHIRAIYEGTTEYTGLLTPGGMVLDCNRASLEFAPDVPKDEIVGRPFWEGPWWANTPGLPDRIRSAVSLASSGTFVRDELRLQRPSGQAATFDFSLHPIRDETGDVVAIVPEARDITALERAGEALKASEERFRSLANASPTIIWTADEQGKITFRNERWLDYAGIMVTDPAPERDLIHPDDVDLARTAWRHSVETGDDHEIEVRVRRADGEYRWFLIRATAQRNSDGAVVQWLGSSNDIHDQKQVEERLRESESEQRDARRRAELLAGIVSGLEQVDGLRNRARRLLELLVPDLAGHGSISWMGSGGVVNKVAVGADPSQDGVSFGLGGEASATMSLALTDKGLRARESGFLHEVVQRVGPLLENARLHQEEKRMALRLQRALLPNTVLTHPDVSIAARYESASDVMVVGGDWYDSFVLPDGRIGLAVGDVVGHGLDAAAAMGRLRIALAAIATQFSRPGEVLGKLSDFASGPNGSEFATAAYAVFDPETWSLEYAAAGHPPMLLLQPGGTIRWLEEGRSQPLGFLPSVQRSDASIEIEPGSTLILYSDGLIERRKEAISVGMARLRSELRELVDVPESEVCDRLLDAMGVGLQREDDVVVMAVRLGVADNPRFHRRFDARPDQLAPLRNDLREWASRREIPTSSANDILIAVGEASANAIEHAYRDQTPGSVDVEILDSGDGWANVSIQDFGEWLPETDHDEMRGRGTGIMRGLVDGFDRVSSEEGTVVSFRVSLAGKEE